MLASGRLERERADHSPQRIREARMPKLRIAGLTRRQALKVGGVAAFAGYTVCVEKTLGQAIKTDTQGIVAGDAQIPIGSCIIDPDAGHGFFADYRPSYSAEASADAWKRCTGLFARTLKT
jgi:hypothetical protein